MDTFREYLLAVVAAAMLCAVVTSLHGKGSFHTTTLKLICGVFMLLVLVSPIADIKIRSPLKVLDDVSLQADQITAAAADSSRESVSAIIKERTQAYILDKAADSGITLSVEVTLSDGDLPEPVSVHLQGSISPYKKKILSEIIETDLGIPQEAQIWN